MDFLPNIIDQVKLHIPSYLTSDEQYRIIRQLQHGIEKIDYYNVTAQYSDIRQGDGWSGFEVANLQTLQKIEVSGIVLSNTCDIAPENKRILPPNIVFATTISARKYEEICKKKKEDSTEHIKAIKSQAVTNRFYLPATELTEDYIVLLDDIHTMPFADFNSKSNKRIYIKLSNAGYYVFILKLAIHFCRFFDKINRDIMEN